MIDIGNFRLDYVEPEIIVMGAYYASWSNLQKEIIIFSDVRNVK